MLQKLREKTGGWIATVILGLLIVPFAFFGVESYLAPNAEDHVARVEAPPTWWASAPHFWPVSRAWKHRDVSLADFQQRLTQARTREQQSQGDAFDARAFETADNKRLLLDQMVDEQVMYLAADRAGIAIGDEAVRAYIMGIEAFQVEGKFDPQRYQLALAAQQLTPKGFETLVRATLLETVVPEGIGRSAFVTRSEVDRLLGLLYETRDVELAVLPPTTVDATPVTDAQAKAWYDGHVAAYQRPEQVTIEYVELNAATMPAAGPPDEAALRKRYEAEKASYVDPEQRMASHILVKVDAGASAAVQKAAEAKATQLTAEARKPGADFAALAKANSDDPGSKDAGGDLGWVGKDTMVKPFEDALFAMQQGEIRGPVKTDYGYHVLQLREIKAGRAVPFEEARAKLLQEETAGGAERAYSDLAGRLVDAVEKNTTALGPAARQLNLPVQTMGPFSRATATGIAANPKVLRAAFSESAINDGTVSDPIVLEPNHSVMLRVVAHTAAAPLPLAQVRDQVDLAVRADRTSKLAKATAEALVARIAKGETFAAVAAAGDGQVMPLPNLGRGMPTPSREANEVLFQAAPPAAGKVTPGVLKAGVDRYAIFVVTKVTPGDPAGPKDADPAKMAAQRKQIEQQLVQDQSQTAAKAYVDAMRKEFQVQLQPDRL